MFLGSWMFLVPMHSMLGTPLTSHVLSNNTRDPCEQKQKKEKVPPARRNYLGNVSETPTPTTCLKSTRQYTSNLYGSTPPHLYHRTFLASQLRRKGEPAVPYASHLYCSTPPICTAVRPPFVRQYFWKNTGGVGVTGTFLIVTTQKYSNSLIL